MKKFKDFIKEKVVISVNNNNIYVNPEKLEIDNLKSSNPEGIIFLIDSKSKNIYIWGWTLDTYDELSREAIIPKLPDIKGKLNINNWDWRAIPGYVFGNAEVKGNSLVMEHSIMLENMHTFLLGLQTARTLGKKYIHEDEAMTYLKYLIWLQEQNFSWVDHYVSGASNLIRSYSSKAENKLKIKLIDFEKSLKHN